MGSINACDAQIEWNERELNGRKVVAELMVFDCRPHLRNGVKLMGRTTNSCGALSEGWMGCADDVADEDVARVGLDPASLLGRLLARGFASDEFREAALEQFAKIEGMQWAFRVMMGLAHESFLQSRQASVERCPLSQDFGRPPARKSDQTPNPEDGETLGYHGGDHSSGHRACAEG